VGSGREIHAPPSYGYRAGVASCSMSMVPSVESLFPREFRILLLTEQVILELAGTLVVVVLIVALIRWITKPADFLP
jgi:hypothetical protein